MDAIFFEGIELLARVGVTPEERALAQPCSMDVEISVDLQEAGMTGDLSKSLDYAALFSEIEKLIGEHSFVLLEEIALRAADLVLRHPLAREVCVRIKKLRPFTTKVRSVGVEIRKTKC